MSGLEELAGVIRHSLELLGWNFLPSLFLFQLSSLRIAERGEEGSFFTMDALVLLRFV